MSERAWPPAPWDRNAWPKQLSDALVLQKQLAAQVLQVPFETRPSLIASVDISHDRFSSVLHGAAVLARLHETEPRFELVAVATHTEQALFPYVSGFLSFREVPLALQALARLPMRPDVLLCDGQGRAHPRRFGLACHLGLLTALPAFGCAKSLLVGKHGELPEERGSALPLLDGPEVVGMALRTRRATQPVYLSVGHKMRLEDTVRLMMSITDGKTRLSWPQRQAHIEANACRRAAKES